jgi:hypothetical protein
MAGIRESDSLKIRSGLPCGNGDERGSLRHTWLERRLIYELKVDRDKWLRASAADPLPRVLAGIPFQLERLGALMNRMVEDFSPAQLVERGPLGGLPQEVRQLLQEALHNAYLASGEVVLLQQSLRAAIKGFTTVAARIEIVWRSGDRDAKNSLFEELTTEASRLRDALALPQGVILP